MPTTEMTTTKTTTSDADQLRALQMSTLLAAQTQRVTMRNVTATRKSLPTHPSPTWTAATNSPSPDALAPAQAVFLLVAR
jgi:hypothetical protein